jgi:hypothetical protein
VENDARRPATKQLVESLHTKIQMLEAELAQLKGHQDIAIEINKEHSTPLHSKMTVSYFEFIRPSG